MSEMTCKTVRGQIDAALDQELDASQRDAFDAHVAHCQDCRAAFENRKVLVDAVRSTRRSFKAPDAFKAAVMTRITQEASPSPVPIRRWSKAAWAGSATAMAASVALFMLLPTHQDQLQRDVVGAHVRSLMAGHLIDVESSDKHTVKPWFNGRIDVSPTVPDLTEQGIALLGGRLDYIDERTAAALVYQSRKHLINVFTWAENTSPDRSLERTSRNGYTVLTWVKSGIAYAVVSDLNPDELAEFQRLWVNG